MNNLLNKSAFFIKRNSSNILTAIGGAGVVVTAVMAVKATPKALYLLEDAEAEKGEELTKFETFKTAAPVYIPSVLMGATTVACIFGANILNKRHQASLMSAYAVLNNSYKEYKNKVKEMYGEDDALDIENEIAKDHYVDVPVTENKELFYDAYSKRYFESTTNEVQAAEYELNRHLVNCDYVLLSHWYEFLGLEPIEAYDALGWSTCMNYDYYWEAWVDFDHKKAVTEDGREYTIITLCHEPYIEWNDCF